MKKVFALFFLCLLGTSTFAAAYAVSTEAARPKRLVLNIASFKSADITCTITDNNGFNLYSDKINVDQGMQKVFNLENLPQGTYFLEIEDEIKISFYEVSVDQDRASVSDQIAVTHKPNIRLDENKKVYLNLLTLGKGAKVSLTNEFEEVLNETFSDQNTVQRVYNLENLERGSYNMTIAVDGKYFYKQINI